MDYQKEKKILIIEIPLIGHEVMTKLTQTFTQNTPDNVEFGGTYLAKLCDGGKSPDFCIFSDTTPEEVEKEMMRDGFVKMEMNAYWVI